MSFIQLIHVLTSAAMSLHPKDSNVPPSTSFTLQTIGRISQTMSTLYFQLGRDLDFPWTSEFTRCGFAGLSQCLVHAPIVPEHCIDIHMQVIASSDIKAIPYMPYIRFNPLEDRKEGGTTSHSKTAHSVYVPQVCLNFSFQYISLIGFLIFLNSKT